MSSPGGSSRGTTPSRRPARANAPASSDILSPPTENTVPQTPESAQQPLTSSAPPSSADRRPAQVAAIRRGRQQPSDVPMSSSDAIQAPTSQQPLSESDGIANRGSDSGMLTGSDLGNQVRSPRAFVSPRAMLQSEGPNRSTDAELWGTNILVSEVMKRFLEFLHTFREPRSNELLYSRLLSEMIETEQYNVNIDMQFLRHFDAALFDRCVRYPQELIPLFDLCVAEFIETQYPEVRLRRRCQVRLCNMPSTKSMRELDPRDIDQLITLNGMVIRCAPIAPDMRAAFYECINCKHTTVVEVDRGRIQEPSKCTQCNTNFGMQLIHNRSKFVDRQCIRVQEAPENMPDGDTPHTLDVYCFDSLVDVAKPGDRVEITGVYRGVPVRVNNRRRTVKAVFKTYIDALHVKKTRAGQISAEDAKMGSENEYHATFDESSVDQSVSEAMTRRVLEIAASPDIYEILTNSIAPNIFELDDVKRGILCLLFGGANKDFSAAGTGRFRGEINALLCGDPGTSKSQLLQYVHKIAPRGIYTSGKGSSAVGLTAYVTRDVDTNEMVLESGALVLSDRGVCCIDEFDKMSDAARSILHEVMEQQTVSIAKAGIICTLNARTSILASANPKESRYNPRLSVVENIQLPPTLMSRFDLIYLILDKPNEQMDRRLAMHIVNLYSPNPQKPARPVLSKAELTAYITHAKKHCSPRLSEEAGDVLVNQYVQLRQLGQIGNRKVITATPRQLESMVRLSEALAKMHLSDIVSADDVHEAARLMAVATQQAATDPRTGLIDMDTITTGHSASERRLMDEGVAALKEFLKNRGNGGFFKDVFPEFTQVFTAMRVTELDFKKMLLHLEREENFLIFNTTGLGTTQNPMIRLQRTGALNERDDADGERV